MVIEKRDPRFQPMRHRHPVDLGEHFTDQGRLDVGIELAVELIVARRSSRQR